MKLSARERALHRSVEQPGRPVIDVDPHTQREIVRFWQTSTMAELEAKFPAVTRAEIVAVLTDAGYSVAEI